jgi:hypothetical protein
MPVPNVPDISVTLKNEVFRDFSGSAQIIREYGIEGFRPPIPHDIVPQHGKRDSPGLQRL